MNNVRATAAAGIERVRGELRTLRDECAREGCDVRRTLETIDAALHAIELRLGLARGVSRCE
jgi:hypothetical protein